MIESLRAFASSWVAKGLLGVLVISFLFFGIDQFGRSSASRVAEIGDREITIREFSDTFNEQLRLSGFRGGPQEAVNLGYHQAVLSQLAGSAAVLDEADDIGLSASDEAVVRAIAETPRFQGAAGQFDRAAYERELEFERLRPSAFEERIRDDLTERLLLEAAAGGAGGARDDAERIWRRSVERRDVEYVILTATDDERAQEPAAGALEAFHADNPTLFTSPERRTVDVFFATAEQRVDVFAADVTADAIKRVYETRAAAYRRPEQRSFDRIIFDDQAQAAAAVSRLRAAGDAAARRAAIGEIAAELGVAPASLALPRTTQNDLAAFDATAATAAFEAGAGRTDAVGAVAGPVEAALGWTVFVVTEVVPEQVTTLEDASEAIRREIALNDARRGMAALQTAVEDQRAAGASLDEIAAQEGALFETVVIDAAGLGPDGQPVSVGPERAALVALAFPPAVAAEEIVGRENEMQRGPNGAFFTATVADVTQARLRPLAEAQEDVLREWRRRATEDALRARAQGLVARLDGGEAFDAIAGAEGLELRSAEGLRRGAPADGLPVQLIEELFAPGAQIGATATAPLDPAASLEIGVDGGVVGETTRPRLALARLAAVQEATSERAAEEIEAIRAQMDLLLAEDVRLAFMNAARAAREADGEVSVDEAALMLGLGLGPDHGGM